MGTEEYVKLIFGNMICSHCNQPFTPDSIQILRVEDNLAIVKIICTHCNENYGIAVVGIETVEGEPVIQDKVLIPDLPPITTDDVIEAHNFINKLGSDWAKYIPDELKSSITEEEE